MGGSLILVPTLALFYGGKQGIAMAALLLAMNNVWKVILYRRTMPIRKALVVILCTVIGAGLGAKVMAWAPTWVVESAVIITIGASFLYEIRNRVGPTEERGPHTALSSVFLAFFAGATSGFSGTSGPLKGIALRKLELDRFHLVGAASVVSLAGDVTKASVFCNESIVQEPAMALMLWLLPLMPLASTMGRKINRELGEKSYATLFWLVMGAYCIRLFAV
jgi:hypothetical protein